MSKHFDRVNNRTRAVQLSTYTDNRPTVYRMDEPAQADNGEVQGYDSLLGYWHILVRNKVTLLCFALAGLAVAVLFSLLQTPVYRARTSLEIQDFNSEFMDLKNVDPTNAGPGAATDSYFQTQIKILQSDSLLERVANKVDLQQERPGTGWGAFSDRVQRMLGFSQPSQEVNKDAFVAKARNNLTVRASGQTRLVEVMYDSEDPKFAALFANTLVSEFIEQSQEMRWKSSQRTGEWLTGHLSQMKTDLEKSEAALQAYARQSGLTMTEKENVTEGRLKELQDELDKAQADRVDKQAKFEETKSKTGRVSPGNNRRPDATRIRHEADRLASAIRGTERNTDAGALQGSACAGADQRVAKRSRETAHERSSPGGQRICGGIASREIVAAILYRATEDRGQSIRQGHPLRHAAP